MTQTLLIVTTELSLISCFMGYKDTTFFKCDSFDA